jgi:hypothetical protein
LLGTKVGVIAVLVVCSGHVAMMWQGGAVPGPEVVSREELGSLQAWTAGNVTLVSVAGSSGSVSSIKARTATYRLASGGIATLSLIGVPEARTAYVVRADKLFYLYDGTDVLSVMFGFAEVILTPSVFHATSSFQDEAKGIGEFATEVDDESLARALDPSRDVRISLAANVPVEFWNADSRSSSQRGLPSLVSVEVVRGLVRLECTSPNGRLRAVFWIDIRSRKLVRTEVDGVEVYKSNRPAAALSRRTVAMSRLAATSSRAAITGSADRMPGAHGALPPVARIPSRASRLTSPASRVGDRVRATRVRDFPCDMPGAPGARSGDLRTTFGPIGSPFPDVMQTAKTQTLALAQLSDSGSRVW